MKKHNLKINIEKGVPLTLTNGLNSPLGTAMSQCEIGDSFELTHINPRRIMTAVYGNKESLGWEFVCRSTGPKSIRIWRVEPRPHKEYKPRKNNEPNLELLKYDQIVDKIIDSVCAAFGISREAIFLKSRTEDIATPRMAVFYCARKIAPQITTIKMGRIFGKDHGTITHGVKACRNRIETDSQFAQKIEGCLAASRLRLNGSIVTP
jgi:hypothetical protein